MEDKISESNEDNHNLEENNIDDNKQNNNIVNTINSILYNVMEEPGDDTNNTNSNSINFNTNLNLFQFNDDESNEEEVHKNFFLPHVDRSNKRLKTVINFPVNMQNFPIGNINQNNMYNYTMRKPSFGYNNSNNIFNVNNHSSNSIFDANLLRNNNMNNNMNHNMNNNINNNQPFLRNVNTYSKTVVQHYPLNLFNYNFCNNLNSINQNNINNNNLPSNINFNFQQKDLRVKRNEIRRNTYPSFQNFNNIQLFGSYNQNNIIEYLIFQLNKTGKIDNYLYNLIKGKFVTIIKNQRGSKIFQKYLKLTHSDIIHLIFNEIKNNLEELITDPYANYFIKKFFLYLNQKDRIDFIKIIEKSIIKLSMDQIGTFPIQTIIEHVGSKNEKSIIINEIKYKIKELSVDPYGSHVLEKLLSCFEEEYIDFIYQYILEHFLDLSYNSNGISIIKKILTFTHKKNIHDKLKVMIKDNISQLIVHPFGNFVIQVLIDCWSDYRDIINLLEKKFFNLSLEKYASNVVERCIEKDEEILNNYISEIIDSNRIYEVMKSNYGNYVIQKALKLAKGEKKNDLIFNAARLINKLNENKLINKWKSILSPYISELPIEKVKLLNDQKFF
jgi:hypothetical protein